MHKILLLIFELDSNFICRKVLLLLIGVKKVFQVIDVSRNE